MRTVNLHFLQLILLSFCFCPKTCSSTGLCKYRSLPAQSPPGRPSSPAKWSDRKRPEAPQGMRKVLWGGQLIGEILGRLSSASESGTHTLRLKGIESWNIRKVKTNIISPYDGFWSYNLVLRSLKSSWIILFIIKIFSQSPCPIAGVRNCLTL